MLLLRKLFAFASGACAEDNQDAQTNHELLTGGHLYGMYLKVFVFQVINSCNFHQEQMSEYLLSLKRAIQRDMQRAPTSVNFSDAKYFKKVFFPFIIVSL